MPRAIVGLEWARLSSRPNHPKTRATGTKALGLSYEKKLGGWLGSAAFRGQWFQFLDQNGLGFCQPDYLMVGPNVVVVLEAKLSYSKEAWEQLERLYFPVVKFVYQRKVIGVQVTKHLNSQVPPKEIISNLPDALALAAHGNRAVWHWIGH